MRHAREPTVHCEELCRSEPVVEAKMFGKKTNLAACLDVAHRPAKNLRLAACREHQAEQHFYRGTLPCAIWSQEAEDLTPRNIEREVSDCHFAAVHLAQPTCTYGKVRRSAHHLCRLINAAKRPDSRHRTSRRDLP